MTCAEFDALVVELARAERLAAAAQAHVSMCEACRASLEEQRRLSRRLRSLAEQASASETPVEVGAALRAAFRLQMAGAGRAVPADAPRKAAWLWPAAALLLAGVGALLWQAAGERAAPPVVVAGTLVAPVAAPLPRAAATEDAARAQALATPPRTSAPSRRPRAVRREEPRAVFMPLLPGDGLDDPGPSRLVRVGLPRAALVSWGWPLEGDVAGETVEADVLVGEDGVARAIRVAN